MKITITGSLGNISKPLIIALIQKGHSVTIISSKAERQSAIEAIGATAAIGSMTDESFLANTFKDSDIVYLMEALAQGAFFDQNVDVMKEVAAIGQHYKQAVEAAGVKKIVHLSSIGGHTDKGVGMLAFHHNVENILAELPDDVSIKTMRPVGFYYNMYAFIPTIKAQRAIISNYGGDEKEPWVSPVDIAAVIAEEMEKSFEGRTVRYIASDEVSPNEVAEILGEAIGKPGIKWLTIPTEQLVDGMIGAGMNPQTAKLYAKMNVARTDGKLYEDYLRNKPVLGKVKLTDFAKDFAAVFNK